MGNESLNRAKKKADDEFYTRYEDVEKELRHYVSQFKDKVIYCNCDIPLESAFSLWFIKNFNSIGLKRLICTSYNPKLCLDISEVAGYISDSSTDAEVKAALSSQIRPLKEDGDFRSFESMQYLRQADIVVTNPPFSLFREVVQLITDFGKDFLLVGNLNAVTYKSIFPLIKDNKARLGYNFGHMVFRVPDTSESKKYRYFQDEHGNKWRSLGFGMWLTTLETEKSKEPLVLTKSYNSVDYPKYDNYDAIEVSKVADIPYDYDGVMGVPVTFLHNYCQEQFCIVGYENNPCINSDEIYKRVLIQKTQNYKLLGILNNGSDGDWDKAKPFVDGKQVYKRVLIQKTRNYEIIGILKDGSDGEWDKAKPYVNGKKKFHRLLIKVIK